MKNFISNHSYIKRICYYTDLICEKIDLHTDMFIERIEALRVGDLERVEFIEKMVLEPLEQQMLYLVEKGIKLTQKAQKYG